MIIWYILAWYIKLIYEYLNERDKGHENGVWKWWYNPIYMLVFLQYFSSNLHHLSDSIFIWNCCNQAQFLNKKQLWSALLLKFLHEMFYNSQFKKKKKIITIATLGIVTTDKHELTFLIFCFHEMQYIPAEIWLFVAIGAVI